MTTKTFTMKFKSETPGAWRYQELDNNGNELALSDAFTGTMYIRKKAMPKKIETMKITVEYD